MKRLLAITISFILILTSIGVAPFNAFSETAPEEQKTGEYFLPIVIEKDGVYQGNEKLKTVKQEGEILVDAEDVKGYDEEKTDGSYVPLDEIAEDVGAKEIEEDGKTVYVKPFQTKRLTVKTKGRLPKTEAEEKVKNADGTYTLEYETEDETEKHMKRLRNQKMLKPSAVKTFTLFQDWKKNYRWKIIYRGARTILIHRWR